MSNVYVNSSILIEPRIFVEDFAPVKKSDAQIRAESMYPFMDDMEFQWACHRPGFGSLTVLDRKTGFGWRDTETGYRDWNRTKAVVWREGEPVRHEARFWLASGMFDIRQHIPEDGIMWSKAVEIVKLHANNCRGE